MPTPTVSCSPPLLLLFKLMVICSALPPELSPRLRTISGTALEELVVESTELVEPLPVLLLIVICSVPVPVLVKLMLICSGAPPLSPRLRTISGGAAEVAEDALELLALVVEAVA